MRIKRLIINDSTLKRTRCGKWLQDGVTELRLSLSPRQRLFSLLRLKKTRFLLSAGTCCSLGSSLDSCLTPMSQKTVSTSTSMFHSARTIWGKALGNVDIIKVTSPFKSTRANKTGNVYFLMSCPFAHCPFPNKRDLSDTIDFRWSFSSTEDQTEVVSQSLPPFLTLLLWRQKVTSLSSLSTIELES